MSSKMSTRMIVGATAGMLTFAAAPIYCIYSLKLFKEEYQNEASFSAEGNADTLTFNRVAREKKSPSGRERERTTSPAEASGPAEWSFGMLLNPKLAAEKISSFLDK